MGVSRKTSRDWLQILEANGIPCAPINDLQGALTDPGTLALNMVVDIEHKGVGLSFKTPGNPVRSFEPEDQRHTSPPLLGEHTREVLSEILSYPEELTELLLREHAVSSTKNAS